MKVANIKELKNGDYEVSLHHDEKVIKETNLIIGKEYIVIPINPLKKKHIAIVFLFEGR